MNYRVKDYENILKKVSKVTLTKYETDYYDSPILLLALEDMIYAYNKLKDEYEKYKEEVKENYKQINVSEQYDIDDRDFI